MKTKQSSRLYYNKYPYKIIIVTERDIHKQYCVEGKWVNRVQRWVINHAKNGDSIKFVKGYHRSTLYFEHEEHAKLFIKTHEVLEYFKPENETCLNELILLNNSSNKRIIIKKHLYCNKFRLKILLKEMSLNEKVEFLSRFQHICFQQKWKENHDWKYTNSGYVYLKDDTQLTLIHLVFKKVIRVTETVILRNEVEYHAC